MKPGKIGENIACKYLEKKGFKLCTRNWHCHWGELDLVMTDFHVLVFVEVKFRQNKSAGYPVEALHIHKLRKVQRAINLYLRINYPSNHVPLWRLDAVCITSIEGHWDIKHYQFLELVEW